jgi:hypothetical protein
MVAESFKAFATLEKNSLTIMFCPKPFIIVSSADIWILVLSDSRSSASRLCIHVTQVMSFLRYLSWAATSVTILLTTIFFTATPAQRGGYREGEADINDVLEERGRY